MNFFELAFISVVTVAIIFLLCMALYNVHLVLSYRRTRGPDPEPHQLYADRDLPRVTVQLPVYNEGQLADQCLRLAAALDYPHDKLQIQFIDDSDEEITSNIARATYDELERDNPDISFQFLRRGNLDRFKAGGLLYATERADGEFIAIFDADFVIPSDFLRKTIHYFGQEDVGAVQARWDYSNCNDALFTRLQANKLDAHQMFEQTARARTGKAVVFHGTAGIWRASALAQSGGWDCLTEVEDVEVTVRSVLGGWNIVYLDHFRVLSELPETIDGFLKQQMRWRRGWSRVTAKYTRQILSGSIPFRTKLDLLLRIHLTWAPIAALLMILSVLPYFLIAEKHGFGLYAAILYMTGLAISLLTRYLEGKSLAEDPNVRPDIPLHPLLKMLPLNYLLFSMGTLWPLTQATFEGFTGTARLWDVTPKSGSAAASESQSAPAQRRKLSGYVIGTLILGLSGGLLALASLLTGHFLACLFYGMLSVGCGYIGFNLLLAFGYSFGSFNRFFIETAPSNTTA